MHTDDERASPIVRIDGLNIIAPGIDPRKSVGARRIGRIDQRVGNGAVAQRVVGRNDDFHLRIGRHGAVGPHDDSAYLRVGHVGAPARGEGIPRAFHVKGEREEKHEKRPQRPGRFHVFLFVNGNRLTLSWNTWSAAGSAAAIWSISRRSCSILFSTAS